MTPRAPPGRRRLGFSVALPGNWNNRFRVQRGV